MGRSFINQGYHHKFLDIVRTARLYVLTCRVERCFSWSTWSRRENSTSSAASRLLSICRGDCCEVAATCPEAFRTIFVERASVWSSWKSSKLMSWCSRLDSCGVFVCRVHTSSAPPPSDLSPKYTCQSFSRSSPFSFRRVGRGMHGKMCPVWVENIFCQAKMHQNIHNLQKMFYVSAGHRVRRRRKSGIWRWNFDAICHSSRDVIISGFSSHIDMSGFTTTDIVRLWDIDLNCRNNVIFLNVGDWKWLHGV